MAISLSGAIAGGAQTNFTSPTHTSSIDQAPTGDPTKRYAVTAIGGTQPSVRLHSGSDPFAIQFGRPSQIKSAPVVSANGIIVGTVPLNVYPVTVYKGMYVNGTNVRTGWIKALMGIPAGADVTDPNNVRAMVSYFIGSVSNQSGGWGDLAINSLL